MISSELEIVIIVDAHEAARARGDLLVQSATRDLRKSRGVSLDEFR